MRRSTASFASAPDRLVIFDVDGTLVQSIGVDDRCFTQAVTDVLGVREISTDWASYKYQTDSGLIYEIGCNKRGSPPTDDITERVRRRFLHLLEQETSNTGFRLLETPGAHNLLGILQHHESWCAAIATGAFEQVPSLIDGSHADCLEIDESLEPLRTGGELVESGEIARSVIDSRCAHYVIPMAVVGGDPTRALYIPGFNEAVSLKAILWPQVRARLDSERVCIVSVEADSGWYHDLSFPGYLWADTENRWTVPGMMFHDGMETYDLNSPRLAEALKTCNDTKPPPVAGRWPTTHLRSIENSRASFQSSPGSLMREEIRHRAVWHRNASPVSLRACSNSLIQYEKKGVGLQI